MQFLRTLFWVLIGAVVVLFASNNWFDVPLRLWAGLTLDIRLPLLLALVFLLGFMPTWLTMRGRIWRLKRRLASEDQVTSVPAAPSAPPVEDGL